MHIVHRPVPRLNELCACLRVCVLDGGHWSGKSAGDGRDVDNAVENKLPFSLVFHGHVAAAGSAALSRFVGFGDVNKVYIKEGNVAHMHQ